MEWVYARVFTKTLYFNIHQLNILNNDEFMYKISTRTAHSMFYSGFLSRDHSLSLFYPRFLSHDHLTLIPLFFSESN